MSEQPVITEEPTRIPAVALALAPARRPSVRWRLPGRRLLESSILLLCLLLVVRVFLVEPIRVPTGSMAPTLTGTHRSAVCPRCSFPFLIGHFDDPKNRVGYAAAVCPNCGKDVQRLSVRECPGDSVLIDKSAYFWRSPCRWELAVFRHPTEPGRTLVKRVVGLPGEEVRIRDGDLYIDRFLARKTLDEVKAMMLPVFDHEHQPKIDGWHQRWRHRPPEKKAQFLDNGQIQLDGSVSPEDYLWLVYRNWSLNENRERPLVDVCGYNGSDVGRRPEPVHDFLLEFDVHIVRGRGKVGFGLRDGGTDLAVEISVNQPDAGAWLSDTEGLIRSAPGLRFVTAQTRHIELALVDRRATLAIDGELPFAPVDLPELAQRAEVVEPFQIGTRGVEVVLLNVRLWRDVHYTTKGEPGVKRPLRLGAGEYFMLGDNSPHSDDSRHWKENPAVPEANLIGKPLLRHWPGQLRDWRRIGWLH